MIPVITLVNLAICRDPGMFDLVRRIEGLRLRSALNGNCPVRATCASRPEGDGDR